MSFERFGIMSGLQLSRPFVCDETSDSLEQIMAHVPDYADVDNPITVVEILAVNEEGLATKVRDIFSIYTYVDISEID